MDLSKLFKSKGNFISATFVSEKKPAAIHKGTNLLKIITGTFRAGIDFKNLSTVKEGIENGERGEVQELPWGKWVKFPYLIQHNGNQYVRLYPTENCVLQTKFLVNGKETNKENFLSFLTESDRKRSNEKPECITVKVSNLIKLG